MKFTLTLDPTVTETEVTVRAAHIDEDVLRLQAAAETPQRRRIIGVRDSDATLLQPGEVTRFFTADKKVYADTAGGTWRVRMRMADLEAALPSRDFIRINQGEIVNLAAVRHLDLSLAGTIGLTLSDGTRCFVARRALREFRAALDR